MTVNVYYNTINCNIQVRPVTPFESAGKCCDRKAKREEECKQKYLYEYFLLHDHRGFLNDAQITFTLFLLFCVF